MAKLVRWVPALTAFTFVLSAAYVLGYFAYIGSAWASSLTPTDLLSVSWQMLPFSVVGIVGGYLLSLIYPPRIETAAELGEKYKTAKIHSKIFLKLYTIFIFVLGVAFPSWLIFFNLLVPPRYSAVAVLFAIVIAFALVRFREWFVPVAHRGNTSWFIQGVSLLVLAYSVGLSTSGSLMSSRPTDTVVYSSGGEECVKILFAGERGVIIRQQIPRTALIPWSEVRRLERDGVCLSGAQR